MKQTRIILAILLVMTLATGSVFADTVSQTVNLTAGQTTATINGQSVTLTAPAQVVNGRTLVPLRFVGEAFGCEVNWVGTSKTATVKLGSQLIEVPIGQNEVIINGEKTAVEVPGQLINGSTFVPLRLIGESLGAKLDYDPATKAISILMNTYEDKTNNLKMVLPADWTVDAADKTGIFMKFGTDGEALFALVDETDGVKPSDLDTDVLFKDYKSLDGFSVVTEGNVVTAAYRDGGLMNVIAYVCLDTGVYVAAFDASEAAFTDAVANQCDLMINTMSSL